MPERQQILQLWLHAAALDTEVAAWAFHDGTDGLAPLPDDDPPYRTGLDALCAGWLLLQAPGPLPASALGGEITTEFVFERRIVVGPD